jgi:hypothetical protein
MFKENRKTLTNFETYIALRITNSFFKHKIIYLTWADREYKYIIDYILVNKKLSPQVEDTSISQLLYQFRAFYTNGKVVSVLN